MPILAPISKPRSISAAEGDQPTRYGVEHRFEMLTYALYTLRFLSVPRLVSRWLNAFSDS
jgi:hypothetical protein